MLLSEPYRGASGLMVWIVAGYTLLAIAQLYTRSCYSRGLTGCVLAIELSGAVPALLVGWLMIRRFGVPGAAYAVPMYFGVQAIVALLLERRGRPVLAASGAQP